MKKIIAAAAITSFVATSAFAGSMEAPEMENEVMIETPDDSGSSASGLVVPLMALLLLGVAAASK